MVKRILAVSSIVFLMLAIPAKDFTALGWNCWYLINKDYVARELCVNKSKPQMHCNGKCHLAKQLKKLEESPTSDQKPAPSSQLKLREVNWIAQEASAPIVLFPTIIPSEKKHWFLQNRAPRSVSFPVFHPPSC